MSPSSRRRSAIDCRLTRTSRVSRFWSVGRSSGGGARRRRALPPHRRIPPSVPSATGSVSWRAIVAQAQARGIYTARSEAMTETHGDAASRDAFAREDESPDELFYSFPRRVVHIDDGAIAALGRLYAEVLPSGGRLLDLMSSWRSHLPVGFKTREVVG